jgi:hypothetical protein
MIAIGFAVFWSGQLEGMQLKAEGRLPIGIIICCPTRPYIYRVGHASGGVSLFSGKTMLACMHVRGMCFLTGPFSA